jgi:hypothetical protein
MTSITWVISLFVVLFVTCCPAVPIGKQYDVSTSDYKFTTDKPIFGRELPINMEVSIYIIIYFYFQEILFS